MQKTVNITSAQLNTLYSSPLTLIPAPGMGKVIIPTLVSFEYKFNTTALGNPDTNSPSRFLNLIYGNSGELALSLFGVNLSESQNNFVATPQVGGNLYHISDISNNSIVLSSTRDFTDSGAISGATIADPGTGYSVGDLGHVFNGLSDASFQITSVDSGGAVTGFTITGGGYGFTIGHTYATGQVTNHPDSTFTVNVTAVTPGNSTAVVNVFYNTITL